MRARACCGPLRARAAMRSAPSSLGSWSGGFVDDGWEKERVKRSGDGIENFKSS